jgi:hypothetical protein
MQGIPALPELKLKYYQLMIRYYNHYNNFLEMTRCYRCVGAGVGVRARALCGGGGGVKGYVCAVFAFI